MLNDEVDRLVGPACCTCQAFQIDTDGRDFRCEKRLIEEAHKITHAGKMLAPVNSYDAVL